MNYDNTWMDSVTLLPQRRWVDRIVYWVVSNEDVKRNEYLSHQHRGGIEYQIGVTDKNLQEFGRFQTGPEQLGDTVLSLAQRN